MTNEQVEQKGREYAKAFISKYGDTEFVLYEPVVTINDNGAHPFSSGGTGTIKKVRVKNGVLEFYHNWWAYGWYSYSKMYKEYPNAVEIVISRIL